MSANPPKVAGYGEWESPITPAFITDSGVGLGSVTCGPVSGDVFWLEARPLEGGRNVVCRYVGKGHDGAAGAVSERGAVDVTPAESNVRTRVHEYGGGAFTIAADPSNQGKEVIIYANFKDQRLYKIPADGSGEPICLTPEGPAFPTDALYRFANGVVDPLPASEGGLGFVCVREDHTKPNPSDVVNAVVSVALDGSGAMQVLASGRDFYAAPKLNPKGNLLAYLAWDHPSMPWDATDLEVLPLQKNQGEGSGVQVGEAVCVAGPSASGDSSKSSPKEASAKGPSVLQPLWCPATGDLHFISDQFNGFWNLHSVPGSGADAAADKDGVNLKLKEWAGRAAPVLARDGVDFGGASPGWALGQQGYQMLEDGTVLLACKDAVNGGSKLVVLSPDEKEPVEYTRENGLPYAFDAVASSSNHNNNGDATTTLYMLGTSPGAASGVFSWAKPAAKAAESGATRSGNDEAVRLCSAMKLGGGGVDLAKYVSEPTPVTFPTGPIGGSGASSEVAHGYYYAPRNDDYCAPEAFLFKGTYRNSISGELPPLLVKAHGGPTSCAKVSFNPAVQFWTSRGFGVLDVDYRGSTGYGRAYRQALRGQWGIVDTEDVVNGAQFLAKQGLVDGARCAIDGGSAGGFTTLCALAFDPTATFKAGCSLYGVADLSLLAGDTHKFESRYLDSLVGEWPKDEAVYKARAPSENTGSIKCPVLFLQGDEDKVVPPNQSITMHAALKEKGLPCALKLYEGEQHGFRQAANIQDALQSELYFFSQVFKFKAAGDIPAFPIDNLD